ncbi:MAG: PEP-CTERM sorting domain-containing protein [Luteolibacter sp.]
MKNHHTLPQISLTLHPRMKRHKNALLGLLLTAFVTTSSSAATSWSFSFLTSEWTHVLSDGSSVTTTGWGDDQYSSGYTVINGITITASFTQAGTAVAHSNNGAIQESSNFTGLVFGNKSTSDQNLGDSLVNYGILTITFSEAVTGGFTLGDIDTRNTTTSGLGWRDALAAEAWNGTAGALGSGMEASYAGLGSGVEAVTNVYDNIGTYYDSAGTPGNTNFSENNSIVLSWDEEFTTVRFYIFNSVTSDETSATSYDHGIGLLSAGNPIPIEEGINDNLVPEPGSLLISLVGGLGFLARRRR